MRKHTTSYDRDLFALYRAHASATKDVARTKTRLTHFKRLHPDSSPPFTDTFLLRHQTALKSALALELTELLNADPLGIGPFLTSIPYVGLRHSALTLLYLDPISHPLVTSSWAYHGLAPPHVQKHHTYSRVLHSSALTTSRLFALNMRRSASYYCALTLSRMAWETARNESLHYRRKALSLLTSIPWTPSKRGGPLYATLASGRLSPSHLLFRASSHTMRTLISHTHHLWRHRAGLDLPTPWPLDPSFILPPFLSETPR